MKDAARKFSEENNAFFVNQFDNYDNIMAQMNFGQEIVDTFIKHNLELGVFCDFVGTGGSFTGCSKALKNWNSEVKCYIVEPENSAVLSDKARSGDVDCSGHHIIQGGGYGYSELPNLDTNLANGYVQISDHEAKEGMKNLAVLEGIFGSFSSGTNLMATVKAMQLEENKGKNGIFSICDTGLKYLSVL